MKIILVFSSLFLSLLTKSQFRISNLSLSDTTLNYLYIGVDNAISVEGLGPENTIVIIGGGGILTRLDKSRYIIRVSKPTDDCQVIISNGTKIKFKKDFKVREVPPAMAGIVGMRDTTIKLSLLLNNPFVSITLPNCHLRPQFSILRFDLSIIIEDSTITYPSHGDKLGPEQLNLIKKLKPGDKIFFDQIVGVGRDGRSRKFVPFWLEIETE